MKISYNGLKTEALAKYEQYRELAVQKYTEVSELVFDIKQFLKERQETKKEFLRQQKLTEDLSIILGSGEHYFNGGFGQDAYPDPFDDWNPWDRTNGDTLLFARDVNKDFRYFHDKDYVEPETINKIVLGPREKPKFTSPTSGPLMVQEINKRNKEEQETMEAILSVLKTGEEEGLSLDEVIEKLHQNFQSNAAKSGARSFVMVENKEVLPEEVREEVAKLEKRISDFYKESDEEEGE
jgi:hypothetical protein